MEDLRVIDTLAIEWQDGLDVLRTLAPAFRDHLGPVELVEANFAKYRQKSLYLDSATTRRIDLVQLDAGYVDLTHCCHDSVEEAYFLAGEARIDGEGVFGPGDYFWRPPGWVHHAASPLGVTIVLGFEGRSNESGPVTRAVCAGGLAGRHATLDSTDERALGTRGRVRRIESNLLVWQRGVDYARGEGPLVGFDVERIAVRTLSRNPATGQQTILMRFAPGYRQSHTGCHRVTLQAYVLEGTLQCGEAEWRAGTFLHRPAGALLAPIESPNGALAYVKIDGRLDFAPA